MAYKGVFFTGNALGTKSASDVLCSFNISGAGSLNLRVYATTEANADTALTLQHSPDGVTWVDVASSTDTTSKSHSIIVSEAGTTTLVPLYPLGRVIVKSDVVGTISVASIGVFMDR